MGTSSTMMLCKGGTSSTYNAVQGGHIQHPQGRTKGAHPAPTMPCKGGTSSTHNAVQGGHVQHGVAWQQFTLSLLQPPQPATPRLFGSLRLQGLQGDVAAHSYYLPDLVHGCIQVS